jgi:hypothetical protein
MPCEALASPADIPAGNLTSPVWPKSFSVDEYATLTFPGRDPCAVEWHNGTYTLHFATDEEGNPTYHSVGHTGYSGPSPVPGKSWALPNGNFYNTIDVAGASAFCICLSTKDPVVDNAVTGPLAYNFNKDAKLIGREKIRPEHFDHDIVADHWVKGPHQCVVVLSTQLRPTRLHMPCLKSTLPTQLLGRGRDEPHGARVAALQRPADVLQLARRPARRWDHGARGPLRKWPPPRQHLMRRAGLRPSGTMRCTKESLRTADYFHRETSNSSGRGSKLSLPVGR